MLQQEFTKDGLPSLRPYFKYLINNEIAEHKKVSWGKKGHERWVVVIQGKKYQYRGGDNFNKSLRNKIVSLYISMSDSSKQKKQKQIVIMIISM